MVTVKERVNDKEKFQELRVKLYEVRKKMISNVNTHDEEYSQGLANEHSNIKKELATFLKENLEKDEGRKR